MPQRCKGTCQQLLECNDDLDIEVRKYIRYGYLNGYKRCSICEVFIKSLNPSNMKCFCCGVQLRSRPYKSTLKENFRNSLNNNNYITKFCTQNSSLIYVGIKTWVSCRGYYKRRVAGLLPSDWKVFVKVLGYQA
jgi:hypothetical protein